MFLVSHHVCLRYSRFPSFSVVLISSTKGESIPSRRSGSPDQVQWDLGTERSASRVPKYDISEQYSRRNRFIDILGYVSSSTVLISRLFEHPLVLSQGVQVAVYGSRTSGTYFTRSTYVMDGDNPTVFTAPPESSSTIYGIQFYNSGTLPNTEHTLIITNYGYWFYLDYFDVTTFNPNEPISENDESTLGLQSSALGFLPGAAPTSISALLSSNHQSSRSRMSSSVRASTPLPMPLFIHSYHLKT